jgi:hypothetical protein
MFIRTKFVTNSSSTSIVAWGVCLDYYDEWKNVKNNLPKVVDYSREPSGDLVYLYVDPPVVSVDDNGVATIIDAIEFRERYLVLVEFLRNNGISQEPYHIIESWYDG